MYGKSRVGLLLLLLIAACVDGHAPAEEVGSTQQALGWGVSGTQTLAAGNNNNLILSAPLLWITPASGGSTITGITNSGFTTGDIAEIINTSTTDSIILSNADANSNPAYDLFLPNGQNIVISPGLAVALVDNIPNGWTVLNGTVFAGPKGAGAVVTSQTTPTLALNGSAVQFDATHDAEYSVAVDISGSVTLAGGYDGDVSLLCDTSTTPTTVVQGPFGNRNTGTLVIGISLTVGGTVQIHHRVRAGDRCRLTTTTNSGSPVYAIRRQLLQILN